MPPSALGPSPALLGRIAKVAQELAERENWARGQLQIFQPTSRQDQKKGGGKAKSESCSMPRQHASAYGSIRQHTSAGGSIREQLGPPLPRGIDRTGSTSVRPSSAGGTTTTTSATTAPRAATGPPRPRHRYCPTQLCCSSVAALLQLCCCYYCATRCNGPAAPR